MSKSSELNQLEESLRDFIIEEYKNDETEWGNFNAFKYRGLTLFIDNLAKGVMPNFKVQIAMLEAEFSIESGKKLSGGLGCYDERLIESWLERGNNRGLLKFIWEGKTEDKYIKIRPFDMY